MCSLKAADGLLFPLERGLIFIHKPVVYISVSDIKEVGVTRVTDTNLQRSFDLNIITRKEEYQFISIERSEYELLVQYLTNKKIKVKNIDEGTNVENVTVLPTTTSRRQRKAPEEELMELPSGKFIHF